MIAPNTLRTSELSNVNFATPTLNTRIPNTTGFPMNNQTVSLSDYKAVSFGDMYSNNRYLYSRLLWCSKRTKILQQCLPIFFLQPCFGSISPIKERDGTDSYNYIYYFCWNTLFGSHILYNKTLKYQYFLICVTFSFHIASWFIHGSLVENVN